MKVDPSLGYEVRQVNGWPALVILEDGLAVSVAEVETDGSVVFGVWVCRNPAKLGAMSRSRWLSRPPRR